MKDSTQKISHETLLILMKAQLLHFEKHNTKISLKELIAKAVKKVYGK